ncbi:DUF4181 domain-containing protein [Bacillus nitroreducens]
MIYKLIMLVLVSIPIGMLGDSYLRRKFKIEKRERWSHSVNKVQTGMEIALFVVYLIGLWFALDYIFFYMMGFFTVLYSLRAFMHWKYRPEKKQYILFIYDSVMLFLTIPVAYWWIFG